VDLQFVDEGLVKRGAKRYAKARVYECTPYGAAENKSLEIKTLRPRRLPRC